MKTITSAVLGLSLAWTAQSFARDQQSTSPTADQGASALATSTSSGSAMTAVKLSDLLEANVTSRSGENLGQVEDLLIQPKTGKIEFAVLGKGGFLGIGEKLIPVPWNAVNLQSERQFTLNVDRQKLESAPTLNRDYSDLEKPDYIVTIERFFTAPSAVGGSESPSGSEQQHSPGSDISSEKSDTQP